MFNIFKVIEYRVPNDNYFAASKIKQMVTEVQERNKFSKPLEYILTCKDIEREDEELVELSAWRDNKLSNNKGCEHLETLLR